MTEARVVTQENGADLYRYVFDQVCDPTDWKAPVCCIVPWELANVYMQAIEFMTGVKPTAERLDHAIIGKACRLTCIGYRAGPCGG